MGDYEVAYRGFRWEDAVFGLLNDSIFTSFLPNYVDSSAIVIYMWHARTYIRVKDD
jgi:hypothetical protein